MGLLFILLVSAHRPLATAGPMDRGKALNVHNAKLIVGSLGVDSFLLTEYSIMDPCYEIFEQF